MESVAVVERWARRHGIIKPVIIRPPDFDRPDGCALKAHNWLNRSTERVPTNDATARIEKRRQQKKEKARNIRDVRRENIRN